MNRLPLSDRGLDEPILIDAGQVHTLGRFLAAAEALADELPANRPVVNLCQNRRHFSTGFAATLLAGGCNLLPANRLPTTIDTLLANHPDAVVLADCAYQGLKTRLIHPGQVATPAQAATSVPEIAADQLAAVVFTSGSTGNASRIEKPWRTLVESSRVNQSEYGPKVPVKAVATVPPQHMWGLETSVLMPLFGPLTMSSSQPFFAADIIEALNRLDGPKVLISAPVHLRILAEHSGELPAIESIYSATAPLSANLARRLEAATGARVIEVYGCSEAGCLARRHAAAAEPWQLFKAFRLSGGPSRFQAWAEHLPEPVALMDELSIDASGRFELIGRTSDLVNVAGKRASLAELTRILLDIRGVVDGVIFQPPAQGEGRVERLAALVVAPGMRADQLRRELAGRIDPAFMPRPLKLVEALPRAESGKLPQSALVNFFRQVSQPAR